MMLQGVFVQVVEFCKVNDIMLIVLMGYVNLIYYMGFENFVC